MQANDINVQNMDSSLDAAGVSNDNTPVIMNKHKQPQVSPPAEAAGEQEKSSAFAEMDCE